MPGAKSHQCVSVKRRHVGRFAGSQTRVAGWYAEADSDDVACFCQGIIQHATINNLAFGRNVDETLRILQAIQYVQENPDEVRAPSCVAALLSGNGNASELLASRHAC